MHFAFDESGDFEPTADVSDHSASVVAGVVLSDPARDWLDPRFAEFEEVLASAEKSKGETKGRLLTQESRLKFCELLNACPHSALVVPATLELSGVPEPYRTGFVETMREVITNVVPTMHYDAGKDMMRELSRQFGNLSTNQAYRLFATAYCIRQATRDAAIFIGGRKDRESWHDVLYEVDRVQVRPGNREEQIAKIMLYGWICARGEADPFILVKGLHTPDHPFIEHYDTVDGVDIGKLVRDNLEWADSKDSWVVRLADIAANIIYRAVRDRNGEVSVFAELMKRSVTPPNQGPGLFSPVSETPIPEEVESRYGWLGGAMGRKNRK